MHLYGSAVSLEFFLGRGLDPSRCSFPFKELTPLAHPSRLWINCLKGQVHSWLSGVVPNRHPVTAASCAAVIKLPLSKGGLCPSFPSFLFASSGGFLLLAKLHGTCPSSGCCNKMPLIGWLKQQTSSSHISGGWMSKSQCRQMDIQLASLKGMKPGNRSTLEM